MANRFFPNYKNYRITSPFGKRSLFGITRTHNGIDLVAKADDGSSRVDYVTAHSSGTVVRTGYEPDGAGNYVYIEIAKNVQMAYFHFANNSIKVKRGDKVKAGDIIAYMGSTGQSTGAHLHWGIKVNGAWIDPTPYLDCDYGVSENVNGSVTNGGNTVNIELNILRKGDKGAQVKTLQTLLKAKGYNIGKSGIDGDFGNDTFNGVKKFQQDKRLVVDGIVGKDTWNKLLK